MIRQIIFTAKVSKVVIISTSQNKPSILFIDDDFKLSEALVLRLEKTGFKVCLADSGQVGLEMMTESSFRAVIVDLIMPEMDGIKILKEIRKTYDASSLPVIMYTDKLSNYDKELSILNGANKFLNKSMDFSDFLKELNSCLNDTLETQQAS